MTESKIKQEDLKQEAVEDHHSVSYKKNKAGSY